MKGSAFSVFDLVDLMLLQAARGRRAHLNQDSDNAAFYEEFFSDLDERVLGAGADRRKDVRLDTVIGAVQKYAPTGRLLDVGCGCGDNLLRLVGKPGLELHGLEYAHSTVERARRALGDRAAVVEGSALDLPYPDAGFDVATCVEVLEHLPDDEVALSEINRVLRDGGYLVLTVPYRHWFPAYRKLIGHERHYERASLTQLLDRYGFDVVEYLPNYPRWHRAADYAFAVCRIAGMIAGRLGQPGDPHLVRLPFQREPLLTRLNTRLESLRARDARLDYATLQTSTSIVARKRAGKPAGAGAAGRAG